MKAQKRAVDQKYNMWFLVRFAVSMSCDIVRCVHAVKSACSFADCYLREQDKLVGFIVVKAREGLIHEVMYSDDLVFMS